VRFWVGLIAALLLLLVILFLVKSNTQDVKVDLLVVQYDTQVWAAMVGAALVGAAATALFLAWPLARLKLHTRRHRKRIGELEQEVHGLRTLPIASDPARPSDEQTQKV